MSSSAIDVLIAGFGVGEVAVEIRDAIHGAVYTNIAAGRIDDARRAAEHQATLPFLRQDPHLAKEEVMAPDALAAMGSRAEHQQTVPNELGTRRSTRHARRRNWTRRCCHGPRSSR